MKKEKKDQFVIAYLADFSGTDTVVSHALHMARMLGKGLILLHISDPRYTTLSTEQAEQQLRDIQASLLNSQSTTHNSIPISYAALRGTTVDIISALPDLLGAVLIVARVDRHTHRGAISRRAILKNFAKSRAAFLVVQKPLQNPQFPDIALTIDFRKESKDKIIWSSYFPRFGGKRVHVLYYDYKDSFLRSKWYATMQQLHKLYTELNIVQFLTPHIIPSKSTFPDVNALRFAADQGYGMLISVITKEKDGLEFFIGTQEQRTIINRFNIPVLFLNPREDLYVLCD